MISNIIAEEVVRQLRKEHLSIIDEIFKVAVPGVEGAVDVYSFLILVAHILNRADPSNRDTMRIWTISQWKTAVQKEVLERKALVATLRQPVTATTIVPPVAVTPGTSKPHIPLSTPGTPPPPGGVPPLMATTPAKPSAPIPAPPTYLTDVEREAWIQARVRGAEFARGLGDYIEEKTATLVRETWDKEVLKIGADLELRAKKIAVIRRETADAVARGRTADELAKTLAKEIGEWGRNWRRIAKTELYGVYNEATVIDAIRWDGPDALIAKLPESDACVHCKRLLLDDAGRPKIFTAETLVNNETNVGKKAINWEATVWPIHPNCRCGTQAIPAGFEFDAQWSLVPGGA